MNIEYFIIGTSKQKTGRELAVFCRKTFTTTCKKEVEKVCSSRKGEAFPTKTAARAKLSRTMIAANFAPIGIFIFDHDSKQFVGNEKYKGEVDVMVKKLDVEITIPKPKKFQGRTDDAICKLCLMVVDGEVSCHVWNYMYVETDKYFMLTKIDDESMIVGKDRIRKVNIGVLDSNVRPNDPSYISYFIYCFKSDRRQCFEALVDKARSTLKEIKIKAEAGEKAVEQFVKEWNSEKTKADEKE